MENDKPEKEGKVVLTNKEVRKEFKPLYDLQAGQDREKREWLEKHRIDG